MLYIIFINVTKLLLSCRGEPRSPARVRSTRLHALRANPNTRCRLYQIYLYKHKQSSSGRMISAPTKEQIQIMCFNQLQYKLNM